MNIGQIREAIRDFSDDAEVELCVRQGPDYAVHFVISEIAPVANAPMVNIIAGEMSCEHS